MAITPKQLSDFLKQPYAWPGGYPLYLLMQDGEALCHRCARAERTAILSAMKTLHGTSWQPEAVATNWEDGNLHCCHCGNRIEPAYEPDDD